MGLRFNEAKTTQAAARLLELRNGRMSYMKLIKLLYLIDREALLRWGRPVTGDRYVSMDRGPVLSQTLDLATDEPSPGEHSVWAEYISEPEHYQVRLIKPAPTNELSQAELALIEEVFARHGNKSRWQLVELSHQLPEWEDPHGGAVSISYHDILKASGKTEMEIAAIEDELENVAFADTVLPSK